ncbi:MAG: PKD domain-containing protein [Candidatus Levyibacteriota bacterium]
MRSKATPTTTLAFNPTVASASAGTTTSFDIMVNPGQNVVSIVEMTIVTDPDKVTISSLTNNDVAFPVKLKGPIINADGTANLSVSTSNDIQKAIQTPTKVATLVLKAKTPTNGAASIVKFDKTKSQVFSLATADGATENVLSDAGTASVTVTGGTASTAGTKPVCSALTLDRSATGAAPYSITFTGTGTSATGTISSALFTFGDNTSQTVTTAGGLGTNTVSVQIAHTYVLPGNYSANVAFTDNTGNVSDTTPCTQAITITATGSAVLNPTATPATTVIPTATPTLVPTTAPVAQNPTPTTAVVPATGNTETTFAVLGGVGVSLIIGILLFVL